MSTTDQNTISPEEIKKLILETIIELTKYYEPPSALEALNETARIELQDM